jgi:hypothetical protein
MQHHLADWVKVIIYSCSYLLLFPNVILSQKVRHHQPKKGFTGKKNKSENIVEILNTVLVILNCMVSGPILYITFKIQE